MVVVDSSSLTLYVTVDLSGIFNAREYIYVMHTAYYNSRGCTLRKKKKKKKNGFTSMRGMGNGCVCWGRVFKEVRVFYSPLHLNTHTHTNLGAYSHTCAHTHTYTHTHLHTHTSLNGSSILLSFFQLCSTFYEF